MADPVFLVDTAGQVVEVPGDQAVALRLSGYARADPVQIAAHQADRAREAEYGGVGSQVGAFAEQALGTATFGGSTWLEANVLNPLYPGAGLGPEDITARSEENPAAAGAGTVTGVALPLVLSMGASAPVSGAEAAATGGRALAAARAAARLSGPGLAARAARAVTGAVEGALPEATTMAGKIAARAASLGAGSAVEGAFYGAGQLSQEAALGDPDLTWQSAVSTLGLSALLGGGLGGAIGAAEVAIPAAGRGIKNAVSSALKRGESAYADAAAKTSGAPVSFMLENKVEIAGMDKAIPGMADVIAGAREDTARWMVANRTAVEDFEKSFPGIAKVMGRTSPTEAADILAKRSDLVTSFDEMAKLKRLQAEAVQSTYDATESALRETNKAFRPAEIAQLAPEADLVVLRQRFLRVHDAMAEAADDVAKRSALFASGTEAELRNLRETVWDIYKGAKTPEQVFEALSDTRRALDELAGWGKDLTPSGKRSAALVRDIRGQIRETLEDPAIWGAGAGRTAAYHAAESAYFDAAKELRASLMRKVKSGTRPTFIAAPTKVNAWINAAADGRGIDKTDVFRRYLDASGALAKEMEISGNPAAAGLLQSLRDNAALTERIQRHGAVTQRIKGLTQPGITNSGPAISLEQSLLARGASAVFPGVVTSAVRGTVQAVTNPARTVTILAALERMAQRTANAIDTGASALMRGAEGASHLGQAELASVARLISDTDTGMSAHMRRVSEVSRLSSDPEQLHQVVLAQNEDWDEHAPDTAQAAAVTTARAYAFLGSKLPKHDKAGPLAPDWHPSHSERAKFARYYGAVQKPLSILKHASAGTLTPGQVEAVQAVYPALMDSIRSRLVEKMATRGKKITPRARIALSMLMGHDVDGRIGLLVSNQIAHQGPSQKQADTVKPTVSGMQKMDVSGRTMTPMQASAARKG